ncbi:xylulokinase [Albimonas pacifica]|uniref:Xylulose kinase n=1 Tax=Albimonas pacifica TaxID=1114924 RepID=A0A1I3GAW2_9RHOB|nr:xylulokinase [Albimonas pacifica]SFI20636.1 xylulokinase [Albimonas pacifica]
MTYLGLDLGTSSAKAALMDADGAVIASRSAPLAVSRPAPGWSEQAPQDWIDACWAALDALAADHPAGMAAVEGIGLSGQMHGATFLGADDRPLRPAILWNDMRSAPDCAALDAAADFRGIGGNLVMPGFTAPKAAWLAREEPGLFEATRRILLPKDYVRLALTGEAVSDMSDASGTLWLDVAARDWSDDLLGATGLDRSHMPALVEGSEVSGRLRPELRARWGMTGAPVVAGGGGDNAAAACGVGALAPGTAFVSLGTSGVLFVAGDAFRPNTAGAVHAFCHAAPGLWHQMGVILAAADALEWLSAITATPAADLIAEAEAADTSGAAPSEALFLPYLSGERTPHNDPAARGAFAGLARASSRADLTRAVLEGVALAFADCQAALGAAGTDFESAWAVGGGARSRLWLRIVAAALDRPLTLPPAGDFGAALGAARLGLCAATGAEATAVCAPPEPAEVIAPEPALVARMAERRGRFRALHPAIAGALEA